MSQFQKVRIGRTTAKSDDGHVAIVEKFQEQLILEPVNNAPPIKEYGDVLYRTQRGEPVEYVSPGRYLIGGVLHVSTDPTAF